MPTALTILFRDEHIVAVHKPAGLLVHRTQIDRHERRFAVQIVRDQIGQPVYPVHRLDKGTSGVLLFGLDRDTTRSLAAAFAASEVRKRYLAVVRGWPAERGEIDSPLDPVSDDRSRSSGTGPRQALTRYVRLATIELPHRVDRYPTSRYSLLGLEPVTGRRHQLRRHLARISHPIVGDSTYGKSAHNRLFATLFGSRRLLLACTALEFVHPVTRATLAIPAPPAEDFQQGAMAFGSASGYFANWGPSSRGASGLHVRSFHPGPQPPSIQWSERHLETQRLKTIQIPQTTLELLESFATNVLRVPVDARRLSRLDELPQHLRRHVGTGPGKQYVWFAWIQGEQASLLTGALAFERSRERGRPVLEVRSYDAEGLLDEAADWVSTGDDEWVRCGW